MPLLNPLTTPLQPKLPAEPARPNVPSGQHVLSELFGRNMADLARQSKWVQPLAPIGPHGVRVSMKAEGGGSGWMEVVRLSEWHGIGVMHGIPPLSASLDHTYLADEDFYYLRAALSSHCFYETPLAGTLDFTRAEVILAHVPAGVPLRMRLTPGYQQDGVMLYMRPGAFEHVLGLAREALPAPLRSALEGGNREGTLARLPITSRIATLCADMFDITLDGDPRRLQLEGRALELAALALKLLSEAPGFADSRPVQHRDIERVWQARDILAKNYVSPPSIAELAKQVGTSQNKLKLLFPKAFGVTMYDFCVHRRMHQAQLLLLEGRYSISQVAERVGYEHQSSFAAAFRDFCGVRPKDYRKQRAALTSALVPQAGLAPEEAAMRPKPKFD